RLEPKVVDADGRSAGLNLTRASLDASVKYPWGLGEGPPTSDGRPPAKFGDYPDDLEVFAWLRADAAPLVRCLDAQVMGHGDDAAVGGKIDFAYRDDDAHRSKVIDAVLDWYGTAVGPDELDAAMDRLVEAHLWQTDFRGTRAELAQLKDTTSQLIGRFVRAAVAATRERFGDGPLTRYAAELVVPEETVAEILVLKGLAVAYVMGPREAEPLYQFQRDVLTDLVEVLFERGPVALETAFAADWHAADDDGARLRVVIDQVASLTDVSAAQWHANLVRPRRRR